MPVLICPMCGERVQAGSDAVRVRCGSCNRVFDTAEAFEDAPAPTKRDPAKPTPVRSAKPTPVRPAKPTPVRPAPSKPPAPRPTAPRILEVDDDDEDEDDDEHPLAGRRILSAEEQRRERIILRDELRRATLGLTLIFAAGWMRTGALALLSFTLLMFWGKIINGLELLVMIAGFLSAGFWVLSMIGNSFLLTGPNRSGTLAFAGAMLGSSLGFVILLGVLLNGPSSGELPSVETERISMQWFNALTDIPNLPMQLFSSILGKNIGFETSGMVLVLGVMELARGIFFGLYLRSAVGIVRNARGKKASMAYVIMWVAVLGMLTLMGVGFATIMKQSGDVGLTAMATAYLLLLVVAVLSMAVVEVKLTGRIKEDLRYRDSGED